MSQTITKRVRTNGTLQLRSINEDIVFAMGSGRSLVLPENTNFDNCVDALNAQVDLSSKQDTSTKLTQLSNTSGTNKRIVLNSSGEVATENEYTFESPLTQTDNTIGFNDTGFLKSTDVGSVVQGFDASILKSENINDTVQAYNSKLNQLSSLNPNSQDILYWNGDSVDAGSKSTLGLQSAITFAQPMSVVDGEVQLHPKLKKIYDLNYNHGDFLRWFDSGGVTEWSVRSSADVLDDINAQNRHPRLTSISELAGTADKYLKIGSDGNVIEADGTGGGGSSYTFSSPLSETAGDVSIDDSNYAKLNDDNAFQGVIQQQLSGSSSYSYTKVFDATSNNTTEFSLVNVPIDPAQAHNVKCEVVAVGHNGATTIRKLSCCVCNYNGTMTQSNEMGDDGLFPIDLGKCEFNVASNFLRVRVQGVDGLTTRYHAKLEVMSVANITQ